MHSPRFEQLEDLPDVDGLFTIIVLQHDPPPVMDYLVDTLLGKIRPGGFVCFQVPTHLPG